MPPGLIKLGNVVPWTNIRISIYYPSKVQGALRPPLCCPFTRQKRCFLLVILGSSVFHSFPNATLMWNWKLEREWWSYLQKQTLSKCWRRFLILSLELANEGSGDLSSTKLTAGGDTRESFTTQLNIIFFLACRQIRGKHKQRLQMLCKNMWKSFQTKSINPKREKSLSVQKISLEKEKLPLFCFSPNLRNRLPS